jgi:hypothetical protein
MSEAVSEAAARLERAVGRLAEVLAKPHAPGDGVGSPVLGIAPERVAELAGRLDNSLARLRDALAELDGADSGPHDADGEDASVPPQDSPPTQDEER